MHIHLHTHKTFFYLEKLLENFILEKKMRNCHSSEPGSSVTRRSCLVIAACNKQFSARLATTIAGRPHLVMRLH